MCGPTPYVSASSSPRLLTVYQERFFVPITNVAHESAVSEVDEARQYVGKEVLILKGHYKGWRGTLRSISRETCEVTPGSVPVGVFKKNDVVVK